MKFLKFFITITLLAFLSFSCSDDNNQAAGLGGPDISPADPIVGGESPQGGEVENQNDDNTETENEDNGINPGDNTNNSGSDDTDDLNIVTNGSFEDPVINGSWDLFEAQGLTGWNAEWINKHACEDRNIPAQIEVQRNNNAADGFQYVELDTDCGGPGVKTNGAEKTSIKLFQELDTVKGVEYQVSFMAKRRNNASKDDPVTLSVNWDGESLVSDLKPSDEWTLYTYKITAKDSLSIIEFIDTGIADTYGVYLDDVRVVPLGNDQLPCDYKVDIDTESGRWFTTEKKPLEAFSKDEYANYIHQIQSIREKIKKIKTEREGHRSAGTLTKKMKLEYRKQIRSLRIKIHDIRGIIGYGRIQKGIETYWANQDLKVKVQDVCKSGWYKLRIVAKNIHGPLPDDYKFFNISIENETADEKLGGISIQASDRIYQRGRLLVYLKEGDTTLTLRWTNDSYKKGEYDANIQIKKITLKWARHANKRNPLVRTAHQYSEINGRFFWDLNTVRTYWKDQIIGFNIKDLEPGKYKIMIFGKNYGSLPLPPDYDSFKVDVEANGVKGLATVPADSDNFKKGYVILDIGGGDTDIYLKWLNDSYKKNEYDANFQLKKIKLKRVDDTERSVIAGYLLKTSSVNKAILAGLLLLLFIFIGGLSILHKKRIIFAKDK